MLKWKFDLHIFSIFFNYKSIRNRRIGSTGGVPGLSQLGLGTSQIRTSEYFWHLTTSEYFGHCVKMCEDFEVSVMVFVSPVPVKRAMADTTMSDGDITMGDASELERLVLNAKAWPTEVFELFRRLLQNVVSNPDDAKVSQAEIEQCSNQRTLCGDRCAGRFSSAWLGNVWWCFGAPYIHWLQRLREFWVCFEANKLWASWRSSLSYSSSWCTEIEAGASIQYSFQWFGV